MSVLWLVSGRLRYSTAAQRRHSNIPSPHCARVGIIIDAALTVLFPKIHKVTPTCRMKGLLQRQFIVGQDIMLARVLLKKGCIVPEHSHHNEQVTYILDGALKFWIDGKEIVVNAGEVLTIPPHMPHKAEALVDTVDLDVFTPPRADWINKTDQYLRGRK